ncbi:MAG: PTS sugar transporter subunit IIA [Planctomycetota bacterium]|jgi:PTS system nitrogen regulatory IIA component
MKLNELLRGECIRVHSTADDKALVLCEIADLARQCEILKDVSEDAILEALQDRETLGATGFGNGVAIPHCRMKDVDDFVVGMMTVPQGVDFESDDRQTVRLVVFIIAPRHQDNTHIRLLSAISQALQDDLAVQKMIDAPDPESLRELFLSEAGLDISEQLPIARNQVQVYVQDEKIFQNILEKLSGMENSSLAIVNTESPRVYLTQSPLYAGFLQNGHKTGKLISMIIRRRLCNEVIRRIESITGSLMTCTGVMVTVQELDYSAGTLDV